MREQRLRGCEKPHSVRQRRVQFEGSFVNPLRVDREHERFAQRFKDINAQASRFGPGRFIDSKYFVATCLFLSRQRLEAADEVKRHTLAPAERVSHHQRKASNPIHGS